MIKKLPENVIRIISSGQIASSPTAVLKELIENSLDAKAKKIKVVIKNATNFSVSDDGTGIPFKELPLTVERFTTSKIENLNDISKLKTYGFRGEALYAIASMSKLTIKSRYEKEKIGGQLKVCENTIIEYKPIPFSQGTKVLVEDLFFNTPVRRKSISKREKSNMLSSIKTLALANPDVTFQINEKILPATSIHERIKQITGLSHMCEIKEDKFHIFFKKREEDERKKINLIFVNRRPVEIPEIKRLMEELNIGSYILLLNLPPEEIDVNVTPLKDRVLIKNGEILNKIKTKLKPEVTLPSVMFVKEERAEYKTEKIKILGTDGTIIIGYDSEYYYFFDQHLIHERVNYEELIKRLKAGKIPTLKLSQILKFPYSKELENKLKSAGIEFFTEGKEITVTAIPEILTVNDIIEIVKGKTPESIASIACKKAIKSGYFPVDTSQVEELFEKYLQCEERDVCPHGRPIYTKIKRKKILKNLGR